MIWPVNRLNKKNMDPGALDAKPGKKNTLPDSEDLEELLGADFVSGASVDEIAEMMQHEAGKQKSLFQCDVSQEWEEEKNDMPVGVRNAIEATEVIEKYFKTAFTAGFTRGAKFGVNSMRQAVESMFRKLRGE